MSINLFPADTYQVVNQTILTESDKKTLISLYEPIIGPIAVSLYLTLWSDLDKTESISTHFTHHHLMTILRSSLLDIIKARQSLEALGLMKSFIKKNENYNEYLYELYSPINPSDFFNHPILGVLLLNNVGEKEYNYLLEYYKKISVSKIGFEEITATINKTFKPVTNNEAKLEEIRNVNKGNVNIDDLIDFSLIEASIPKGMINPKAFNKKTKELINQLSFVYNIDSVKMSEILRLALDPLGMINKDKLKEAVRKNYEYNNNGSLPTLIYRTQPDYLKSPDGDNSARGKMIKVFENTKPYDFLTFKYKGIRPSTRDLNLLEKLATEYDLPAGVINVLVDYVLRVNDGKLNKNYVETIALDWSKKDIKRVPEAMEIALKKHNKNIKPIKEAKPKMEIKAPAWMYQENRSEEMTQDEIDDLESMFEEFR